MPEIKRCPKQIMPDQAMKESDAMVSPGEQDPGKPDHPVLGSLGSMDPSYEGEQDPRSSDHPVRVSLVVPIFNEHESIVKLHEGISKTLQQAGEPYEVLFVDDGSSDGSWREVESLAKQYPEIRGIKLRRNFGKAAALDVGFRAAVGEVIITMDADLQDDPTEIPRFLDGIESGLDVVSGWKKNRQDPWHKTWPSLVFNRLVSRLTGVRLNDHNCGFKAYRRQVFDDVQLYGERHRFVPVLAAAKGWKVGEIEVKHHARPYGQSKYGVSRLLKGSLDLMTIFIVTGYGRRPLHFIGTAGVICFALGGLGMLYLSIMWVVSRLSDQMEVLHLHQTAIFFYCITAVIVGAQFMLSGLIAEFIVLGQAHRHSEASVEIEI